MNPDAVTLLAFMEAEYVRAGYMYSGEAAPNHSDVRSLFGDWSDPATRARTATEELLAAGLIRRRECQAESYALTARRRVELVDLHDLRRQWAEDALDTLNRGGAS